MTKKGDPKKHEEIQDGKKFDLYTFGNPMVHEDWHKAEELGLEYVGYLSEGNDYWDHSMIFVKKGDFEVGRKWLEACW